MFAAENSQQNVRSDHRHATNFKKPLEVTMLCHMYKPVALRIFKRTTKSHSFSSDPMHHTERRQSVQSLVSITPGPNYISVSESEIRELHYPLHIVDVILKSITLTDGEC